MRTTRGRIYKDGKKGFYHLQFYVNGKQFRQTLRDKNNRPITNEEEAQAAADVILRPYRARKKADFVKEVAQAAADAETVAKAAEAEAEARKQAEREAIADQHALKIAEAWKYFTSPDNRLAPECSPRNLGNYRTYWTQFSDWLKEQTEAPVYMREVTETLAKRYAGHLEQEGCTGNTFNKKRAFLFSFFKALSEAIRGEKNPFDCIQRKKKVRSEKRRNLTREELNRILSGATGELGLLLWIGATTGLRLGDAVTLDWRMIDLREGIIRNTNRKTGADVIIGIIPVLGGILSQMPENQRQGYLMPELSKQYLTPKTQPHFIARIQRYFQSCGIETTKAGTGPGTGKRAVTEVGFHSLRHSFATLCGESGTAEGTVQKMLGHSKVGQTLYYQHSTITGAKEAALQLNTVFRDFLPDGSAAEALPEAHAEAERAELRSLADTLPIEKIRKALDFLKNI